MHRGIGTVVLAAMLAAVPAANAFTLGETGAAMAVQGTLAKTNGLNVAGTINGVKNALGAATDQQNKKLGQVSNSWGGKSGGQTRWSSNARGSGKGWMQGTARWGSNGRSGGSAGWQTASAGSKVWANGSWGQSRK